MHLIYNWYLRQRRMLRCFIAIVWTVAMISGSLLSLGKVSSGLNIIPQFDKVLHFTAYLGFGILWLASFPKSIRGRYAVITVGLVLGLLIEYLQKTYTVDRHYEVLDIIANITGLTVALLLHHTYIKKRSI